MRLILLPLLCVTVASADTRSDLQTALRGLAGDAPLRARVAVELADHAVDAKDAPARTSAGSAIVSADAEGLHILWSRDQLPPGDVGDGGENGSEETAGGALRAMESLTISRLTGYLNAAPDLLRVLADSVVTAEQQATWHDQPARLVTLKVTPKLDEKSRKYIKELDAVAKIWLGMDGLPIAAERRIHVRGRAMLVISFESTEEESYEFARVGDRLVVTRHTKESRGSGAGENSHRVSAARLELDPPAT
jgi:hypothetical protein